MREYKYDDFIIHSEIEDSMEFGKEKSKDILESVYGVGPHTISVPRIRKAVGVDMDKFPYIVSDKEFKKN